MKKNLFGLLAAFTCALSLASCGKEATTTFAAKDAVLTETVLDETYAPKVNTSTGADKVEEGTEYVRLVASWVPTDPQYTLSFTFTADKEADATYSFKMAAPIADPSQGNLGDTMSALYTVTVNGTAVDVTAWDDTLGLAFNVENDALVWVNVTYTGKVVAGTNTVTIATVEKNGAYGDYIWHCTDSPCIESLSVTTKAKLS